MKSSWMAAFLAVAFLAACSSNPVDSGTPNDNTNTGNNGGGNTTGTVSFSATVLPILTASCSGGACHAPGTESGVSLTSYNSVMSSVGNQYGTSIVLPGNANGSPLVEKVSGSPRFGSRMPLGGAPLSSSQITSIRTWVNEGARNN